MKKIQLSHGESILAIVPDFRGAGWDNSVVWVYIRTADGRFRSEVLETDEQSPAMRTLLEPGSAMDDALRNAVPVGVVYDYENPKDEIDRHQTDFYVAWQNAREEFGELREAMMPAIEMLREYIESLGDCDHAVNICICGDKRILDDAERKLSITPREK